MTRADVVIIAIWQYLILFNIQQLMPIFLNQMPSKMCTGSGLECFEVVGRCDTCDNSNSTKRNCSICGDDNMCAEDIREDNKHIFKSAALEFGQYCKDEYHIYRVETCQYVGLLFGTIIFGFLSDKFGRKYILLLALTLGVLFLELSAEMENVDLFLLMRFLIGLSSGGTMVVGWSYVSELIKPENRMALRVFSSWPQGRFMLTMICFLVNEWRWSTRVVAIAMIPLILALAFLLPESYIWLATKRRTEKLEEAVDTLNRIAGFEYVKKADIVGKDPNEPETTVLYRLRRVCEKPILRKRLIILFVFWFVAFYSSYTLDLNSNDMLADNFFVGQFVTCAVATITKYLMGAMDHFVPGCNRRRLHLFSQLAEIFFLGVLMILQYYGLKSTHYYMVAYLGAVVSIELCMDVCHLIINELMPTEVRGAVSGVVSMVGRIAMVLSGVSKSLQELWSMSLFILMAAIGVFCFIVSYFFLEDTKNTKLQDIAQGTMKRKNKNDNASSKSKPKNLSEENVRQPSVTDDMWTNIPVTPMTDAKKRSFSLHDIGTKNISFDENSAVKNVEDHE